MSKLQVPEAPPIPLVTVTQVTEYFTTLIDKQSILKNLVVRGELSEVTNKNNGALFFVMKDGNSILNGVMFTKDKAKLKIIPKAGDKVDVTGAIVNYEAKGCYQIRATDIILTGKGPYFIELEKLKKKLAAEGFFDEDNKKAIPPYCKKVGIITTDSGKGFGDIVVNARNINPYVEFIFVPAKVEGASAGQKIAKAIRCLDQLNVECIILGRGGGGANTLYAFNEEIVAREIFNCKTPIISAVGHEGDWTIADLVADVRVSTPTAAAHKATYSVYDALYRLNTDRETLLYRMQHMVENKLLLLDNYESRLQKINPGYVLERRKLILNNYETKLAKLITKRMDNAKAVLDRSDNILRKDIEHKLLDAQGYYKLLCAKLDAKSPLKRLSGGYAYASKDSQPVLSVQDVKPSDNMELILSDGRIECSVDNIITTPFKG